MAKIQQLDAHGAELIAAGEVVDRPAGAIKELMENAIDAGARRVTVEIQRGGISYMRVTDDGCGIEPEDCLTAFLRHAASKIRTEYDLEAIGTLGFRGEALAAIAAVSRVELMTRTESAPAGTALLLDGGVRRRREEVGCPKGTTLIVRDLFFNTPARQKFLKRDSAEGSAVFAAVQHAALSHPEVSFRFLRDGKQELQTPGDGQLKSAVYAVLGRDIALGLLECKGSAEEIRVSGFASRPVCCRGSRSGQFFFVNGRYVKSRTMQAALEQAYQNQKMVGNFPACVLHITTGLNAADVNIHPTKTEVSFASEKQLFEAVYGAVKAALEGPALPPEASLTRKKSEAVQDTVTPNQTWLEMTEDAHFRGTLHTDKTLTYATDVPHRILREAPEQPTGPAEIPAPRPKQPQKPSFAGERYPVAPLQRPEPAVQVPPPEEKPKPAPAAASQTSAPSVEAFSPEPIPWRLAGEVLNTYVIVERGEEVWLIDKHAAHERMNFDRLKAMHHRPMGQLLLEPLILHPAPEECAVLLEQLPLLREFGFEAEDFGGGSLVVRQAPDDLPTGEIGKALEEIASALLRGIAADPDAARDEVLHTIACKAAIKGGWHSEEEELRAICEAVLFGGVRYCPHGRPVALRFTRRDFEKQFKRA